MTRTRYLIIAIASFFLVVLAHRAWADGAPPVPTPQESKWIAIVAIVAAILSGVSIVLHVIAPLTKTKVDDELRDELDRIRALIAGTPAPKQPPDQAGRITVEMVIGSGLVMLGATMLWLLLMSGCTPANRATLHKVEHESVDCVKAEKAPALVKLMESVELLATGSSTREVFDSATDALIAGAGDVATCALKHAGVDIAERLTPSSLDAPKVEGQEAIALDRINGYIARRGIVYASPSP